MTQEQWRTLTHAGAYHLTADADGQVTRVEPVDQDPDPSAIGQQIIDNHGRVLRPLVRQSWLDHGPFANREKRGDDELIEVDWSTALSLTEQALRGVISTYGNDAIYGGSYGWASAGRFHHAQSQLKRFLNCIGGYVDSIGTYSHGAAEVVIPATTGLTLSEFFKVAPPADELMAQTDTLISFGGFPASNTQITSGGDAAHWYRPSLHAAKERGCRLLSVAPNRTRFDEQVGATWLPIHPGTDAALMLALVHELTARDPRAIERLQRFGAGTDVLLAYLAGETDGRPKDRAWATTVCGLESSDFEHLLSAVREPGKVLINATWSTQRVPQGEQAVWALLALGVAVGQIGQPGSGIAFGLGSMGSIGRPQDSPRLASVPQGRNPIPEAIPVSRIADALLNPGSRYTFAGQSHVYPRLELLYWAGGNPFHHHQDLFRLDQAWRRPAAVIVHEPFLTATAQRADIVLPTTTGWERHDVGGASTGRHLVAMQASPSAGDSDSDARDDYDIFCSLAERLGEFEHFSEGRNADEWIHWLYQQNRQRDSALPDWDTFQSEGIVERSALPTQSPLDAFLADPSRAPLATPSGRIHFALEANAGVPPHPQWPEPGEDQDADKGEGSLRLISPMPPDRLHSQLAGGETGPAPVSVHPDDARRLGLVEGAPVTVKSDQGSLSAIVTVTTKVRPGVVLVYNGRWFQPQVGENDGTREGDQRCEQGNANALTADRGTSGWAQACATPTFVRLEPAAMPPPK